MAKSGLTCLKCRGSMEQGYVLDRGELELRRQEIWVEGTPETSLLTGLKTRGHAMRTVTTWRCRDCGLLESYAN